MDRVAAERAAPFQALEEKMMKYKRECDAKYKADLEAYNAAREAMGDDFVEEDDE